MILVREREEKSHLDRKSGKPVKLFGHVTKTNKMEVKFFINSFNPMTSCSNAWIGTKLSHKVKRRVLDFHIFGSLI